LRSPAVIAAGEPLLMVQGKPARLASSSVDHLPMKIRLKLRAASNVNLLTASPMCPRSPPKTLPTSYVA